MKLALRELRRRPGRFGVAAAILTLIALLLVFLGGLLDGLIAGSTGALRAQRADAIVFSGDSEESLVRSRITPAVRAEVERSARDARVAGLGSVQLGARLEGRGPRDLVAVVLFGAEVPPRGAEGRPPPDGRVLADDSLRSEGVREGDVLRLGPARTPWRSSGSSRTPGTPARGRCGARSPPGARSSPPTARASASARASCRPS